MIKYLSPSFKILMSLVFVVFIAVINNSLSFILCTLTVLLSLCLSGVEFKNILKTFKPMWVFIMFLGILTMLTSGIADGLILMLRIVLITLSVSVLINTTTEAELQKGILTLLSPLKKLHIPTGDIAFVITLVLRFIPRITDEWQKLSHARMARGIVIKELPAKERIKILTDALGTLVLNSMKSAEATAVSADSRCFGLGSYTPRKKDVFSWRDFVVFFFFIIFCIFLGLLEFLH